MKLSFIILLIITFPNVALSQKVITKNEKNAIENVIKLSNSSELILLSEYYKSKMIEGKKVAFKNAQKGKYPIKYLSDTAESWELMFAGSNNLPVYYSTANNGTNGGAITSSTNALWPGGSLGLSLAGDNMKIGLWEVLGPRASHREIRGRVNRPDGATTYESHGTHVSCTLIGKGINNTAKGMSYNASIDAYDWNNDYSEMCLAAANGMLISSHSYVYFCGWKWGNWSNGVNKWHFFGKGNEFTGWMFGSYMYAREWDMIAYNAPYYLIVKAAGNEHNQDPWSLNSSVDTTLQFVYANLDGTYQSGGAIGSAQRPARARQTGYDLLDPLSNAKNIITVANVYGITGGYTNPSGVIMNQNSSWGKTDDGRIKPDLSAKGSSVWSASAVNDSSYESRSGTSMSTPMVAGSLLLLQQHYFNQTGNYMRASTLKGLVLHTADEAGTYPGPDYKFGWGLLNTKTAANIITHRDSTSLIKEEVLYNQTSFSQIVYSNGNQPLSATICWIDPPAADIDLDIENSNILRLVNDLDVRIYQGNNVYMPYVLNPSNPDAAATNGDNSRDNVEKVFIQIPSAGVYTIKITHKGIIQNTQNFSLIVSGINCLTPSITSFSPINGKINSKVIIKGNNFSNIISVKFNNTSSHSFTIDSINQITAYVPASAENGKISVINASGQAISANDFIVSGEADPPTILSFYPMVCSINDIIKVKGEHFTAVYSIKINTSPIIDFFVLNDTVLYARIPKGARSGKLFLQNTGGNVFSNDILEIKSYYVFVNSDDNGVIGTGPSVFSPYNVQNTISLKSMKGFQTIIGGTWMKGKWMITDKVSGNLGGRLYEISIDSGIVKEIGRLKISMYGISYDITTQNLYGVSGNKLFTINTSNADTNYIGTINITGSNFVGIACNSLGDLYSVNVTDNKLYKLNKTNASASLIGSTGILINVGTDMEFDLENDSLFLLNYNSRYFKYYINTQTGSAVLQDTFRSNSWVQGFAIPYSVNQSTFSGIGSWKDINRWSNGVPDVNTVAQIKGNASISDDVSCKNLAVNPSASLSVEIGKILCLTGKLTLLSDSSGIASFINNGIFHSKDTSEVHLYLYGNASDTVFHIVSSPINQASVNAFWDYYMYRFNETDNSWSPLSTNNTMTDVSGYFVYYSLNKRDTVVFKGNLNNDYKEISLSYSPPIGIGWNLVGNPYPSSINWMSQLGWTRNNCDNAFYVWNPSSDLFRGTYATYIGYPLPDSTNGGTRFVAPMQGFFVKCNNIMGGLLAMDNRVRLHNNTSFLKKNNKKEQVLNSRIKIIVNSANSSDETIIRFNENANDYFDIEYDALKFYADKTNIVQLASVSEDKKLLAINTLKKKDVLSSIDLNISSAIDIQADIQLEGIETFNPNIPIILEDLQLGKYINMLNRKNYTFITTDLKERFRIHFQITKDIKDNLFDIYTYNNILFVNCLSSTTGNAVLSVCNTLGQLIYFKTMPTDKPQQFVFDNLNGIYFVNIKTNKDNYSKKVFIKKSKD